MKALQNFLEKNKTRNSVIATVPHRHDLINNSCVNKEIRKTNIKIKKMCSEYANCSVLDIGKLHRNLHTKHGFHLNYEGKKIVCDHVNEIINGRLEINKTVYECSDLNSNNSACNFLA